MGGGESVGVRESPVRFVGFGLRDFLARPATVRPGVYCLDSRESRAANTPVHQRLDFGEACVAFLWPDIGRQIREAEEIDPGVPYRTAGGAEPGTKIRQS